MYIPPVTLYPVPTPVTLYPVPTPVTLYPVPVPAARIPASNVSAATLKAANGNGEGRTGTASSTDGETAAQAAHRAAPRSVDIKA